MRFLALFAWLAASVAAAVPPALEAALKDFRTEPPKGWSFTQTTEAEGKSTVERFDAGKPDYNRWSLVRKDGEKPNTAELTLYAENRSRRSRGGSGPKLAEQLDLATLETVAEDTERTTYRCALKGGESGDKTARFLRATLVLHKPTGTIESLELGSTGPFSPTLGVRIAAMRTTMTYSLPADGRPSLPQAVTTHVRGRAFWVRSLDADMRVTFSDYARAGKK